MGRLRYSRHREVTKYTAKAKPVKVRRCPATVRTASRLKWAAWTAALEASRWPSQVARSDRVFHNLAARRWEHANTHKTNPPAPVTMTGVSLFI
jgi:hypothetical protein